ncbi:MAG TPA: CHRD domain-containing protein [Burkholderiales bacterium]|nr:CHRD domain-containing protein [Burkholderiales bacterium]
MTFIKKAFCALALVSLAACGGMMGGGSSGGGKSVNVSLSPAEEVPPASSAGSGRGSFTIGADGAVSGSVSTTGVQGTMAHIHRGAKGQNGPVVVPLVKNGDTYSAPPGAKLNEAQLKDFRAGNLYVNVHSDRYKGGEVRGQLNP